MLNSFFLKCELQLLKFELNLKFVCVLDPQEREINFVHYFLHPACVMDHPSCATGPASQRVETWRWEHARTHAWESVRACVVRRVGGVDTHTRHSTGFSDR